MGLDMYLNAGKYVPRIDYEKSSHDSWTTAEVYNNIVSNAGLDKVQSNDIYGAEVSVNVAYWRKANQIHKWFVDNVQDGVDDCNPYPVNLRNLISLRDLCVKALESKDTTLLPTQEGFFFGDTEYNEWYWKDIEDTITQLNRIIDMPEAKELSYSYHSSW